MTCMQTIHLLEDFHYALQHFIRHNSYFQVMLTWIINMLDSFMPKLHTDVASPRWDWRKCRLILRRILWRKGISILRCGWYLIVMMKTHAIFRYSLYPIHGLMRSIRRIKMFRVWAKHFLGIWSSRSVRVTLTQILLILLYRYCRWVQAVHF